MAGKPTRIGLTLDEEDFKHLVRGEAATLEQTDVEVSIILADIGYDRMYAIIRQAIADWMGEKGESSVTAYVEGRATAEVLNNIHEADKEMPLSARLGDEQNAALTMALQQLVVMGAENSNEPELVNIAVALYAFQLGHDYARKFGAITDA